MPWWTRWHLSTDSSAKRPSMLVINSLIQWCTNGSPDPSRVERILSLTSDGRSVYAINVQERSRKFVSYRLHDLMARLTKGDLRVVSASEVQGEVGSAPPQPKSKETITRLRTLWDHIHTIVQAHKTKIFDRRHRGPVLRQAAANLGIARGTYYRYFWQYFQTGARPYAFRTNHHRCGCRDRPQTGGKRGVLNH